MIFRMRYAVKGGHVHVRVFERPSMMLTNVLNGELVFDQYSWAVFRPMMERTGVEVLHETDALPVVQDA